MNITTKVIPVLILNLFLSVFVHAQKGGLIYYLKNSGKLVSTKDSADYSMVVMPPDTSVNKKLFVVYEYYKNGKVKLLTNSKTRDINLLYQGRYIAYYPDGKKKRMGSFKDGKPAGHEINYFPNGRLYYTKSYITDGKATYGECRDSTGKVLAENGNGRVALFDEYFTDLAIEGKIDSGAEEGLWHLRKNDSLLIENVYSKGKIITSADIYKSGERIYEKAEVDPEFPGGKEGYNDFLRKNFSYPEYAHEHHQSGVGVVSFIVEKDGRLTNFKILLDDDVNKDFSAAVLKMMKLSPPWNPGLVNGQPVRTICNKTTTFTMTMSMSVRRF